MIQIATTNFAPPATEAPKTGRGDVVSPAKRSAAAVKGFEVMRMFKKSATKSWQYQRGINGDVCLVKQTIRYLRRMTNDLRGATVSVQQFKP